jgi:hypothetical protein
LLLFFSCVDLLHHIAASDEKHTSLLACCTRLLRLDHVTSWPFMYNSISPGKQGSLHEQWQQSIFLIKLILKLQCPQGKTRMSWMICQSLCFSEVWFYERWISSGKNNTNNAKNLSIKSWIVPLYHIYARTNSQFT